MGYNLFKNGYIGIRYNIEGYTENNFSDIRNTKDGIYLTISS